MSPKKKSANVADNRSIEWHAISNNRALITSGNHISEDGYVHVETGEATKLRFRPFNNSSGDNRFAMFIPFSVDSRDECGDVLMCIEGHLTKNDPSTDQLHVLLKQSLPSISQCSRLLVCIGRNNIKKHEVVANMDNGWRSSQEILSALRDNLLRSEDIHLSLSGRGECKFRLWYGCVPLKGTFTAVQRQLRADPDYFIHSSPESLALDYWRELVLNKRYSPAVMKRVSNINIFDSAKYMFFEKLVQLELNKVASR